MSGPGTSEDIYPLIPPVDPYLALPAIATPFRRRALLACAVVFVLYQLKYTSPRTLANPPAAFRTPPSKPPPSLSQTPLQKDNEARLLELIDYKTSSFDSSLWHGFDPPLYSAVRRRPELSPPHALQSRKESQDDEWPPVTAVMLHWKRRRGLELVFRMVAKHPYIREVIVWNNNVDVTLSTKDFLGLLPTQRPPHVRVVNAASNVHDLGKHTACSMASYETCYFNDDDWLNMYMDALYTKYADTGAQRNPRIVSNTMPIIHLEHRRWRFSEPDIDLHAGFTWLGTGSFSPRTLSARFLNQLSSLPSTTLLPSQVSLADMFFSLWTNTWPDQVPNELVPIDVEGSEVGWSRGEGVDQWAVVHANILEAVRRLYTVLSDRDPHLSPYPFHRALPTTPPSARAPCGNDACLFLTSFNPFPGPGELVYPLEDKPKDLPRWWPWSKPGVQGITEVEAKRRVEGRFSPFTIRHINEHEALFNSWVGPAKGPKEGKAWPGDDWWVNRGSWHRAVNEQWDTCWSSGISAERGDFVGLHFVQPRHIASIMLVGSQEFANVGSKAEGNLWEVQTMAQGSKNWTVRALLAPAASIPYPDAASMMYQTTLTIEPQRGMQGSDHEDEPMKIVKLRLVARGKSSSGAGVEVCGWKVDDFRT